MRVDPSYKAGSRAHEEQAAIEEILATVPAAYRERVRQALDPESGWVIVAAANPRVQELLIRIYDIRDADYTAERLERSRQAAATRTAPIYLVLTASVPGTAPAVLLRRKTARPQNLILIRETTASPLDLATAVAVMMRSRAEYGDDLLADMEIEVSGAASSSRRARQFETRARAELAKLSALPVREIPGVGAGRMKRINIAPLRSKPRGP